MAVMIREITSKEDYLKAKEFSKSDLVFILKHSLTCPVSFRAYSVFENFSKKHSDSGAHFFLVKIQSHRDVSNYIEMDTEIIHESPQVIVLKNEEVIWQDSHYMITEKALDDVFAGKFAKS